MEPNNREYTASKPATLAVPCAQCASENALHLQIDKAKLSLHMMRLNPEKWYRDAATDQRDLDLISAPPVPWLLYDQSSFVRKIVSRKPTRQPLAITDSSITVPLQSQRSLWSRKSSKTYFEVISDSK